MRIAPTASSAEFPNVPPSKSELRATQNSRTQVFSNYQLASKLVRGGSDDRRQCLPF
jgi:hypothetical protein